MRIDSTELVVVVVVTFATILEGIADVDSRGMNRRHRDMECGRDRQLLSAGSENWLAASGHKTDEHDKRRFDVICGSGTVRHLRCHLLADASTLVRTACPAHTSASGNQHSGLDGGNAS